LLTIQFVFNHLNEIPKSPHGCDFSRVKPWYLEGHAKYLRQTLLLGRHDLPEARALFNQNCHNVAGKLRVDGGAITGVLDRVRPGVRQIFEFIDRDASADMSGTAAATEADTRLEWFTKKTLPLLLRSARSRDHTLLVVPSYFDFVRVTNALRKSGAVTFAQISEYSSPAEISKARTLFFKGKRAMLVVTERFHFYRRYKLRGAHTVVFYQLPVHAAFYAEFLSMPFAASQSKGEVDDEVDPADVSSRVLVSRFDCLRLERVVGKEDVGKMLRSTEPRFEYV
jgi:U3 small nucleolar RNA-associated protein 25